MTHPIIKTDNYILITSDEEIKEGDYWHYLGEKDNPVKNVLGSRWFEKLHDVKMYKKIIAHLPLNNEPILEGVPLLPPLPNEKNDLASQEYPFLFIEGYKKAKEKYKFTEEDMIKAFEYGKTLKGYDWIGDLIESLSQPKLPVGFKCEMERIEVNYRNGFLINTMSQPKIINGVMQGEWIFE